MQRQTYKDQFSTISVFNRNRCFIECVVLLQRLGSDNIERNFIDNELELRDYELTRTRTGFSATIDYNFNSNHSVYVWGLYTRFTDREWRRRYVFLPEDGEVERLTKDRFEAQGVNTLNLGGKSNFNRFNIDYDVQYAFGYQETPYDNEAVFVSNLDHTIDDSDFRLPKPSSTGYLTNSNYSFNELEMGSTTANDQNLAARLNINIPYHLGDYQGMIKTGGKIRIKTNRST